MERVLFQRLVCVYNNVKSTLLDEGVLLRLPDLLDVVDLMALVVVHQL